MVNKFGTARILGDLHAEITPQERVNLEMLRAVEALGKRLERTENERDRLAERLAMIESCAAVDEKTGKLYLPVVVDPRAPVPYAPASRWAVGLSLLSSTVAVFALCFAVWHTPQPAGTQLTPQQLAALNALAGPLQMADSIHGGWKKIDEVEGLEPKVAEAKPAEIKSFGPPAPAIKAPGPVRSAALPSHVYGEFFGPSPPPVAEASEGWRLDEKAVAQDRASKPAPAPVKEAAAPAPEKHATVAPVEQEPLPPVDLTETTPQPAEAAVEPSSGHVAGKAPEKAPEKSVETVAEKAPEKAAEKPSEKIAEKPAGKPGDNLAETADVRAPGIDITPDPALSPQLQELEKKAFSGAPEAQHDLATMYASGKSVAQDYKRAAYWFYKAADGGIANADYNLGVMFQQGMGVRKDVNKALGWYEKAAQLGHPEAMYNLGIAYVEGVGTTRNIDRGVSYFKKAANAGVAQAAYNLGVLYESNFVGAINLAKAAEWYQVAADEGHASARDAVARLKQQIAVSTRTGDQGAKVAAEPTPGVKDDEEVGEGDSSPADPRTALLIRTQSALIAHGDLTGKPSGVLDDKTSQAIRAWQNKLDLAITGEPTPELLDKVQAANAGK